MSNISAKKYLQLVEKPLGRKRSSPETDECKAFHRELQCMLTQETIANVFQYTHFPMERLRPKQPGREQNYYHGHLIQLQLMGTKKGLPDYLFVFNDNKGAMYLEFKAMKQNEPGKVTYKGTLSADQKLFQEDCKKRNIPYFVVYNKREAIEHLNNQITKLFN